jgi:lysophospholipid acyltransferase (LPLAT)-like uncharacterized protein
MKDPFNSRGVQVYRLSGLRRALVTLASALMRLYYGSLRLRLSPDSEDIIRNRPRPCVFVVWHNRSLVAVEMFQRYFEPERISCLISPSRAAAWEVAFFEDFKLHVVRGSSSRRGIPALREMIRQLRQGYDVGISPDGPSGPLYSFKHGTTTLARLSHTPMLALNANCRWAIRLPTWDRHLVPLPFAKVTINAHLLEIPENCHKEVDNLRQQLRKVCLDLLDEPVQHLPHDT